MVIFFVDKNFQKPTLYITLFEKQLLRSYILSDHGNFINQLSEYFRINIITSNSLAKVIEVVIEQFNLASCTSITIFDNYQENTFTKALSSAFRFGNKSSATIQLIQLGKSLGDSSFRTNLRYVIYFLVSNSNIIKYGDLYHNPNCGSFGHASLPQQKASG